MKRILFSLFLLLALSSGAYSQSLCAVSGTLYDAFGNPARGVEVRFTPHSGAFILTDGRTVRTNASGAFTVNLIQSAYYYVQAAASGLVGRLDKGVLFQVPAAASATLSALTPAAVVPLSYLVSVPNLTVVDSASGTPYSTDSLRLTAGFKVIAPANGGNTPAIQVDVSGLATTDTTSLSYRINVNKDGIAGKADGDSVKTLYDIAGGKGDSDSLETAYDVLGGKGDSDSLSTATATANAAIAKADSNALHAQKFAVINDRLAGLADGDSVSLQVALIKNIIAALADADSVKLAFDRLGDRENADSTTSKASASLDSALTAGARSMSSTGRIFVSVDSLTLDHLTNTIDCSLGNEWRTTTTQAADTIYFSNWPEGQAVTIAVTQGGTGQTVVFDGVRFATAPTLTATQYKADVLTFIKRGDIVYGTYVQGF